MSDFDLVGDGAALVVDERTHMHFFDNGDSDTLKIITFHEILLTGD